jgi:protein-S-isoprenylcysteine O-methyltransferase Ste14
MNTMSTSTVVALIALVIVVVVAVALIVKTQRSKRLRTRFGPEYHRAIEETGSATRAESKLLSNAYR